LCRHVVLVLRLLLLSLPLLIPTRLLLGLSLGLLLLLSLLLGALLLPGLLIRLIRLVGVFAVSKNLYSSVTSIRRDIRLKLDNIWSSVKEA
jgi:hypothetical protein